LGDIYTCHGFLLRTGKFEKADNITFLYKLIKGFVDEDLVPLGTSYQKNLWNPLDDSMQLQVGELRCHKI
jgi:hypothetical protein